MRIYFDVCCLNRPFDDQTQARVRLESEAVRAIFLLIKAGQLELVSSGAVISEIARIADSKRRVAVEDLSAQSQVRVPVSEEVERRALQLVSAGLEVFDALHVAYAETAACGILFTVDDALTRRMSRLNPPSSVRVINPAAWVLETQHGGQTSQSG